MKIVYSDRCLGYEKPGHPESPERVRSIYEFIKDRYDFVGPGEITDEMILAVHTQRLFDSVREGTFVDPDTPNFSDILDLARFSAAAAVTAADIALNGEPAFSLMRPPGHHAGRDSLEGFCYFNNIAVATLHALSQIDKVAIVDFDCHHGNGTQDIFLGDERVRYVSTHESPLYPGTGGESKQNCLNYPLPAGTDEEAFMSVFDEAMGRVREFVPDLVAVSAGFDSYRGDPLTRMSLEITTFEKIGQAIRELHKPTFAVLEGGYSAQLKECVRAFLEQLA